MTRIRWKKRARREFWRTGAIREDSAGMARLRSQAWRRSGGMCECYRAKEGRACTKRVNFIDGHLHHIKVNHAKSDVLEQVAFLNRDCHREITGEPKWTPTWLKEWTA